MRDSLTSSLVPALALLAALGSAAPATDYIHRPVSVSVFPLLSTNGPNATNVISNFSLNIIGGYLGGLRGCEIGSVFNAELGDARGYQVAGLSNIVAGDFTGVQQSGVVGVVGRDMRVLQQAGAFSMVVGNVYGCQMAGGACVTLNELVGVQMAGGVNYAKELRGAQVAPVNITGEGHGLQLGVVNIADDIDVPIGIVNIVRNGQFHVSAWTSEATVASVGIKTGSKKVYSVLTLGLHPDSDSSFLLAGLGIGGHIPLAALFFVDIDGVANNVYRWPHWLWTDSADGYRFLATVRVTGGWQIADDIAIIAGPTANLWLSSHGDARDLTMYGLPVANFHGGSFAFWPGFTAGLQLF